VSNYVGEKKKDFKKEKRFFLKTMKKK